MCRDKCLRKWLRKSVTTIFPLLQHKRLNIEEELCRDRTWEECNKSVKTKKDNVVTRFVNWMSKPGRTCHDIKAHVATLETGRKEKFYRYKISYVTTRN